MSCTVSHPHQALSFEVSDFLEMEGVPEPHSVLLSGGLLHQWSPGMFVLFVSHQWLGATHPDPHGQQAAILRHTLHGMISGSLHVEEDLISMPMGKEMSPQTRKQIASGYLFLDWFAIPQITARQAGVNEDVTRTDAALAVKSTSDPKSPPLRFCPPFSSSWEL